ncbi:hypothetical protein GCM10025768_16140 [Microbacterium pseudoresistens]|uniref:PH domain-containing protein n=1 Tax=Microbacterium pseudoresistens TaxID=640634 RepID=A0A7Y9JMX6_9MICO|nr:PH domain-containing protein [Microbacterium pseudoresistens]NYD53034.1 hypothetical protein [Microbacterium pseudoresistens]
MTAARPPRVFRVTGSAMLLGITVVGVVLVLVDAVVRSGAGNALLIAPWPLLLLWGVYVTGIASDIRADAAGARVQNLLRRTWMPWSRVARIGIRWQVEFTLDDGAVVRCFGGPAHSRPRRLGPGRTKEQDEEPDNGLATLHRLRNAAASAPDAPVERSWDVWAIVVLVILVAWAAVAVLLTR